MELSCSGDFAPASVLAPSGYGVGGGFAAEGYRAVGYRADGKEKVADKAVDFWQALREQNNGNGASMKRFTQQHSSGPRPTQTPAGRSAVAAVTQPNGAPAKTGRCPQCHLPIGELAYHLNNDPKGPLVHGECQAQLMLQKSKEEEEARQRKDAEEKKARREQYEIGWKMDMVPVNRGPAAKLGFREVALEGMCCLTLDEASNTVSLSAATDPATSINLEYLSLALQVRTRGGRDPMFSLDPKLGGKASSPDELHAQWQVKRFEPEWLAGTSVGEVMFQADVHLKELSMGEYAQPVMGMKSCFELLEEEGLKVEWCAREWFVVKKAEVLLSGDGGAGVLVPFVQMGVEAREQIRHPDHVEDAPLTRKDHPLVKYADAFTRYFDVIAERKSVIYHIRELAKATVLAKFLVDGNVKLEEAWYDMAGEAKALGSKEIPQLWNERCHTSIQVRDGKIVDAGSDRTCAKLRGVYGGVEFGTDRVQVVGFRRPVAAVLTEIPRGVDLNLDQFNLSAPRRLSAASHAGGVSILEGAGAKVPLGKSFWSSIVPGTKSVFSEGHKNFFRDLFNPHLSDRRSEGSSFVPPDTNLAYVQKLQSLLHEEAGAAQGRKEHFCSENFSMEEADPLFPASWAPAADIVRQNVSKLQWAPPGQGGPQSRTKLLASAPGAERVVASEAPVFDQAAEDGTRFRIYQVGGLEIRTIQEEGRKEAIGAVFSSRAQAKVPMTYGGWNIKDSDIIVKVLEYVESSSEGAKPTSATDCRYYIVLETDQGNFIATEKLSNQTVTWEENPINLEARNYLAKVTRFAECRNAGVAVREMRAHKAEVERQGPVALPSSESYARAAFARAQRPAVRGPESCLAHLAPAMGGNHVHAPQGGGYGPAGGPVLGGFPGSNNTYHASGH